MRVLARIGDPLADKTFMEWRVADRTADTQGLRALAGKTNLVIAVAVVFVLSTVLVARASSGGVTVTVRILKAPFGFSMGGVKDGGSYNAPVTPVASSHDPSTVFVATLNGEPYVLGTEISTERLHTLRVTASNGDGETLTRTFVFEIDRTPPVLTISGVIDGAAYNHTVVPSFSTGGDGEVTASLNGVPFVGGTPVQHEGAYTLVVAATDRAGNSSTETVTFVIDVTPPDVIVLGVSEGRTYDRMVTPVAMSTDPSAVLTVTLNGAPYFGGAIAAPGTYELVVSARDPAGNVTTRVIAFSIDYLAGDLSIELAVQARPDRFALALTWRPIGSVNPVSYRIHRTLDPVELLGEVSYSSSDGTEHLDETVLAGRTYYYAVRALDGEGREIGESNIATGRISAEVARLWGDDRIGTAVDVSRNTFAQADTVILATSGGFADALAASGLAGSYRAPILLTRTDRLTDVTRFEISRLRAKHAFIVGGVHAVGPGVERALRDQGLAVTRLAGQTRYETAVAIAEEIQRHALAEGRTPSRMVFLARGDTFPDALSLSSLAYSQRVPVLFTRPGSLPAGVRSYVQGAGFSSVTIAGGTGAVSEAVVADFVSASGASATRVGGADRFATSALLSRHAVAQGWAQWRAVGVATGADFPDALSGSVHAGEARGVMLLTPGARLSTFAEPLLRESPGAVFRVTVFGGVGAVSADVETALRNLLEH